MRPDRKHRDDGPDWLGTLLMAVLMVTLLAITLR